MSVVYSVCATGYGGVERIADSLETAKRVCVDYLSLLSAPRPIVEDWADQSAVRDGSLVVRYFQDGDVVREQRIVRHRVDTAGTWFRAAPTPMEAKA